MDVAEGVKCILLKSRGSSFSGTGPSVSLDRRLVSDLYPPKSKCGRDEGVLDRGQVWSMKGITLRTYNL